MPKAHIINYGRGRGDMLVGDHQISPSFFRGDDQIQGGQNGGITKFTLHENHKIDFEILGKANRGFATFCYITSIFKTLLSSLISNGMLDAMKS